MNIEIRRTESGPNNFDRARQRFGPWGMIKGRILADIIGEDKASRMLNGINNAQEFKRLREDIAIHFKNHIAALNPEEISNFLRQEAQRIKEEIGIPESATREINIHESGDVELPSSWGKLLNSKFGDPFSWSNGALKAWGDPTHDNEARYLYY